MLLANERRAGFDVQYLTQVPVPEGETDPLNVATVLNQRLLLIQLRRPPSFRQRFPRCFRHNQA